MKSQLFWLLLTICLLTLALGCSKSTQGPDPDPESVSAEIDSSGGSIEWEGVTVEVPEDAVDESITITLAASDVSPADSLGVDITVENTPIFLEITGGQLNGTLELLMPGFSEDDPRNSVCFLRDGLWQPLSIQSHESGMIRVALPAELLQPGRNGGIGGDLFQMALSVIAWPGETPVLSPTTFTQDEERPAIVLMHGVLADNSTWIGDEGDLIAELNEHVGDVWHLEWPWYLGFRNVVDGAIAEIESELGDRPLYFLCHSKGGLLGRAIIRRFESSSLDVRKAIFLGTPHYGTELTFLESLARGLFQGTLAPLVEMIIHAVEGIEGIEECLAGSDALASLATSLDFGAAAPGYFCIVGDVLGADGGDLVVSTDSADLAAAEHAGEREDAIFSPTLEVNLWHCALQHYHSNETWPNIYNFLQAGCQITVLAPSADTSVVEGDMYMIEWQKGEGCSPRVNLRLLKGGEWIGNIEYNIYGNSHPWHVGTFGHGAGADYQVRVHDDESQYNADSPFFTIGSP